MSPIEPGTWVEHLTPAECWELLSLTAVGRVGVVVDGGPEVYPVNHVVDHQSIVFRTDPGNKLRAVAGSPRVCYQADGVDMDERTGWSVLVKGRAEEITDPEARRRAAELPLALWSIGDKAHWLRVTPSDVSGRRIARVRSRADAPWRRR